MGFRDDDDDSLCSDDSLSNEQSSKNEGGSTNTGNDGQERTVDTKETKNVRRWKLFVLVALCFTGALVSIVTFLYLDDERKDTKHEAVSTMHQSRCNVPHGSIVEHTHLLQFHISCNTVREAFETRIATLSDKFHDLGKVMEVQAEVLNQTFPFVTTPQFEVYGEQARRRSGVEAFVFSPLVTQDQQEEWEAYSFSNQDWLEESRDIVRSSHHESLDEIYLPGSISPSPVCTPSRHPRTRRSPRFGSCHLHPLILAESTSMSKP
jgi:hypothetical protein